MAIGSSAQAFAASAILTVTGIACKYPGQSNVAVKGYAILLDVNNPFTQALALPIQITGLTINGNPYTPYSYQFAIAGQCQGNPVLFPPQLTFNAPQGTSKLVIFTTDAPNSKNTNLVLSYSYINLSNQQPVSTTATGTLSGDPVNPPGGGATQCQLLDPSVWPCQPLAYKQ